MDTALYWLNHPTNTTTSASEHSTNLITTRRRRRCGRGRTSAEPDLFGGCTVPGDEDELSRGADRESDLVSTLHRTLGGRPDLSLGDEIAQTAVHVRTIAPRGEPEIDHAVPPGAPVPLGPVMIPSPSLGPGHLARAEAAALRSPELIDRWRNALELVLLDLQSLLERAAGRNDAATKGWRAGRHRRVQAVAGLDDCARTGTCARGATTKERRCPTRLQWPGGAQMGRSSGRAADLPPLCLRNSPCNALDWLAPPSPDQLVPRGVGHVHDRIALGNVQGSHRGAPDCREGIPP
ncbi:hypothetical protein QFZ43_008783 [Streptomyces afghaniensis]|nr:hypothetical protein [Streptomyces afghaniensis]